MMAANWKMNKTIREAQDYVAAPLPRAAASEDEVDVGVFVPFTCLSEVARMAQDSAVFAGAQNFFYEDSGAFTGEISAPMLLDVEAGFLPVICVGETEEEREAGQMWEKVSSQVRTVIEELGDASGDQVVFAY